MIIKFIIILLLKLRGEINIMKLMYHSKKNLCLFMTLIMLLTGLCFFNIKAEPYLKCADNGSGTLFIDKSYNLPQGDDICTNELISSHVEVSSPCHVRRNVQRQIVKSIAVFWLVICTISKTLHTSQYMVRHRNISKISEHFIISYTHHQDGSKG